MGDGAAQTARSEAHRRTAIADLAGLTLDEVSAGLVADVLAAVEDVAPEVHGQASDAAQIRESRAHAFRVARYELTDEVRRRPELVPRHARATRRAGDSDLPAVDRVRADLHGVAIRLDVGGHPHTKGAVSTVADLERSKRLRVVPGLRLADGLTSADVAGLLVIGAPELCGDAQHGGRPFDLLTFTATHPRAARTEPGDVVFTTRPRLAVWVDPVGGAIVEAPARGLRVISERSPDGDPNSVRGMREGPRRTGRDGDATARPQRKPWL